MEVTSLDREALAALPADVRNEVLQEEATERRRRESIDIIMSTSTSAGGGGASAGTGTGTGNNIAVENDTTTVSVSDTSAALSSVTSTTATAVATTAANDNFIFLSTLTPDLRRDVLLTANEEFIASLPTSVQSEARQLRDRQTISDHLNGGLFQIDGQEAWEETGRQPLSLERVLQQAMGRNSRRMPTGGGVLASMGGGGGGVGVGGSESTPVASIPTI
eukprot:gene51545-68971_t